MLGCRAPLLADEAPWLVSKMAELSQNPDFVALYKRLGRDPKAGHFGPDEIKRLCELISAGTSRPWTVFQA